MSDTPATFATISQALGKNVAPELTRLVNSRARTLGMLKKKPSRGQQVVWSMKKNGVVVENYTDAQRVTNFGSNAYLQASLGWGQYLSAWRVGSVATRAAKAQAGNPAWAGSLDMEQAKDAVFGICSQINVDLFTGSGASTYIAGLDQAIATDNTYGGLDRSDSANAYFRSNVVDPGSDTELTLDQLRSDQGTIFDAYGVAADIAIAGTAVYNKIVKLFDNNIRYVRDVQLQDGRQVTLSAAVQGVELPDGATLIRDKDCPSGKLYYLNSNEVWIEALPMEDASDEVTTGEDGFETLALALAVSKLGRQGVSDDFMMEANCQLVVKNPRSCLVRKHIAV